MNKLLKKVLNRIGVDNLSEEYRYELDEKYGYLPGEKKPEHWVKTTCGYCSVGCGMEVGIKEAKAVTVRGDKNHPVNYGKLCPKGLSQHEMLTSPHRALYPLMRLPEKNGAGKTRGGDKNNKFFRISWDEALNVMTQNFSRLQEKHGKGCIGIISTGQLLTEEFYALGKLAQLGIETPNYDGNTTLCMASAVAGYKRSFGGDGPPASYEDFALADTVFLIGANIAENHPILTCWLQANPKKTVITADPRVTKTAMLSDIHLPLKPHSDIALLNGIMQIVIENKWVDKKYIEENTTGFLELKKELKKYTPQYVSKSTGISSDLLFKAAEEIGLSDKVLIAWTMGVNHSTQGTETVNAINNLCLIRGQVGKPGSAPFSITGQCNAMGSREASFSSSMPGYRNFGNIKETMELAKLWRVDHKKIPRERGMAYPEIIEGVIAGKIKGLWIIGTNPLVSYPNQTLLRDVLGRLDFVVAQDGFHPTPTTLRADLILPAAIWGEKEGTYTNSERRVSKANAFVEPPGEAKSDLDIFLEAAQKMGKRKELFGGWASAEGAFEEWKKVSRGRFCDYSGMSYSLIEEAGGIQWPFTVEDSKGKRDEVEKRARATRRLYGDAKYRTGNRRANLIAVHDEEMPEAPNERYPFVLNTGRTVEHWHTRTKTGGIEILERLSPKPWIEMNPDDALRLKFKQGQAVRVVSRRGMIPELSLRITEIISPGQVFIPFHWNTANANNLTINAFDPFSREPNYKQAAVRVEEVGEVS